MHTKQLEKHKLRKPKVSGREEIRAEINENEMKETITKINETKSWFFEKISKIDKLLNRFINKKGRRLKSIKLEIKNKLQETTQKYKGS